MEKLSTSQMRQNGLTAFEAELVNYILANEISEGTTFHGVPGHPRYGASKEEELVVVFNSETLSVERVGKKVITINFADYTQGRKRAATNTTATSNNTNTNNNNNNNNMEDQNATTTAAAATANNNVNSAALNFMSQMFAQQQEEGYQRGKAEAAAEVDSLKKQLDEAKNAGTGSVINVVVDGKKTTTKTEQVLDPNFENILHLVAAHENVYLYGPAGSGKNTIAYPIAHPAFFRRHCFKWADTVCKNITDTYSSRDPKILKAAADKICKGAKFVSFYTLSEQSEEDILKYVLE